MTDIATPAVPPTLEVYGAIDSFFRARNLKFLRDMDGGFLTGFGDVSLLIRYIEPVQVLVCTAGVLPPHWEEQAEPPPDPLALNRLLLNATYSMAIGKLSRDQRDGEIRFDLAAPLGGGPLTEPLLEQLLGMAVSTVKQARELILAQSPAGDHAGLSL